MSPATPERLQIEDLPKYSVRIRAGQKTGTGFFVAPTHVLTCAHVVTDSSGNGIVANPVVEAPSGGAMQSFPARVQECLADTVISGFDAEEEGFAFPDIALLEVSCPAHPYLKVARSKPAGEVAYYGFTGGKSYGETTFLKNEGFREYGNRQLMKFSGGQVVPGHSGAAILDRTTGLICGMLNWTRNRKLDLGGFAVTGATILECFQAVSDAGAAASARTHRQFIPALSTPFFVGREKQLAALAEALETQNSVLLYGLSGVGKSELALRYCELYGRKYDCIVWANAKSQSEILGDLLAALRRIGNDEGPIDDRTVVPQLSRLMQEGGSWLLILNSVESVEDLQFLAPYLGGGKVLAISTRIELRAAGIRHEIPLLEFEKEEASEFLLKRSGVIERTTQAELIREAEAADVLAGLLGYLPLALEVAAGYIESLNVTIASYVTQYQETGPKLLDRHRAQFGARMSQSTMQACLVSFHHLSPEAKQLLGHLAVFGTAPIPFMLLQQLLFANAPEDKSAFKLRELVYQVMAVSLGRRHRASWGEAIIVNRLVQEMVRTQMSAESRASATATVSMKLALQTQDRQWLAPLLPHVIELANRMRHDGVPAKQEIAFRTAVATALLRQSLYSIASSIFGDSIALAKSTVGANNPSIPLLLMQYADLHFEMGDYSAVLPAAEEARQIAEPRLRDANAASRDNMQMVFSRAVWFLAMVRRHTDFAQGLQLLVNGIAALTAAQASKEGLLELRSALPLFLRDSGLPDALNAARQAQTELVTLYPPDARYERDRAAALATLGEMNYNLSSYEAAVKALNFAWKVQARIMGEDHVETAETKFRLGLALKAQPGLGEDGGRLMRESLATVEKLLGPEHRRTVYLRAVLEKS
jgi:hypothetical protein